MVIPYVTFMKHAEKVSKSAPVGRPILKGVYHKSDGSLTITDSHRLYFAKNAHSNEVESVVNPKTGKAIEEGTYPETSRLLPLKSDAKFTARLSVKEASDAFAALQKVGDINGKGNAIIDVKPNDDRELIFSVNNSVMSAEYKAGNIIDGNLDKLTFNASYMNDALSMFKAVGVSDIEFRYYGAMRPFTISTEGDDLLALLLPIRRAVD